MSMNLCHYDTVSVHTNTVHIMPAMRQNLRLPRLLPSGVPLRSSDVIGAHKRSAHPTTTNIDIMKSPVIHIRKIIPTTLTSMFLPVCMNKEM